VAFISGSPLSVRKYVGRRTSPVSRKAEEHNIVDGTRSLYRFRRFIHEHPQTLCFCSQRAAKVRQAGTGADGLWALHDSHLEQVMYPASNRTTTPTMIYIGADES